MPKYYCDYCDTFLTHDSPSVRKTHCNGRKHKEAVRMYYQTWMEEQAQKLIDATTAAYKAGKLGGPLPPYIFGMGMPPPGIGMPPPGGMPSMGPPPPMGIIPGGMPPGQLPPNMMGPGMMHNNMMPPPGNPGMPQQPGMMQFHPGQRQMMPNMGGMMT